MPFESSPENIRNDWYKSNSPVADDIQDNLNERPFWELHMAIFPSRENALKAAQALRRLLRLKHPQDDGIRIYITAEQSDLLNFDGTIRSADRDERGKEICVHMDYHDDRYHSQRYLKTLMLDMWKAMQDAGVQMAWLPPPAGERPIEVSDGSATPFSYSSFKPYKQRYRILHETAYNPTNRIDPIEHIESLEITTQDLADAQIQPMGVGTFIKRQACQKSHYNIRMSEAITALNSESYVPSEAYEQLTGFLRALLENDDDITEEDYQNLLIRVNPLRNTAFPAYEVVHIQNQNPLNQLPIQVPETQEARREACVALKTALTAERDRTVQKILNALPAELPVQTKETLTILALEQRFDANPEKMQRIVQKLVFLQHEKESFEQDKERLLRFANTNFQTSSFPDSYQRLIVANNPLESARRLLNDYTKDNSRLNRIFSGVWRHHAGPVNQIVRRIGAKGGIESMDQLLDALARIRLQNPQGALARRIDLISKLYAESELACEKKVQFEL